MLAALIGAVMTRDLEAQRVTDPDLEDQVLSPRRALRELGRIRAVRLVGADGTPRQVITRPSPLQSEILAAFGVDTSTRRSQLTRVDPHGDVVTKRAKHAPLTWDFTGHPMKSGLTGDASVGWLGLRDWIIVPSTTYFMRIAELAIVTRSIGRGR